MAAAENTYLATATATASLQLMSVLLPLTLEQPSGVPNFGKKLKMVVWHWSVKRVEIEIWRISMVKTEVIRNAKKKNVCTTLKHIESYSSCFFTG